MWNWSLSPDGKLFAAVKYSTEQSTVQLVPVSGGPRREIKVKEWNAITSIDWAADSRGFFISSNPTGHFAVSGFGRERPPPLEYEETLLGELGNSFARWKALGDLGPDG